MYANTIVELDDGNVEVEVIAAEQPVLVEFADNDKRMDVDLLDEMSHRYAGRARIAHLDTSINYDAPCRYEIQ